MIGWRITQDKNKLLKKQQGRDHKNGAGEIKGGLLFFILFKILNNSIPYYKYNILFLNKKIFIFVIIGMFNFLNCSQNLNTRIF
jgi:hypothetical protein